MKNSVVICIFLLGVKMSTAILADKQMTSCDAVEKIEKIDVYFIANEGQLHHEVLFSTFPTSVFVLKDRLIINGIEVYFIGMNKNVKVTGLKKRAANFSYFVGNDPTNWRKEVSSYSKILFENIYPNIDLMFTGLENAEIEFQWIVKPYAEPDRIRFEVRAAKMETGNDCIGVFDEGNSLFKIKDIKAFQGAEEIDLELKSEKNEISFTVGKYDKRYALIIDPSLDSLLGSTYLGTGSIDWGEALSVDDSGNVFVTGTTSSSSFPIVNGYDPSFNGQDDVFIAKFNPGLDSLLASTFLGGSGTGMGGVEWPYCMFIDRSGNVFVSGRTSSSNFPIVNGYDPSHNGYWDVFVAKLCTGLDSLLASTYLGGSDLDEGYSLFINDSGQVFVTGETISGNFPIVNGYDPTFNGEWDCFVAKLSTGLDSLLASTYLGGSGPDDGYSVFVSDSGNVFVGGTTYSSNFPIVDGYDPNYNGVWDGFLAKLNPGLDSLVASTYIGGSASDYCRSLFVDGSGDVYATGHTASSNFPVTLGAYDISYNGGGDGFVVQFSPDLDSLRASTFFGGSNGELVYSLFVDGSENVYAGGRTHSADFPIVNGYDPSYNGSGDVFVAMFNSNLNALLGSTYLGGGESEYCYSLFVDASGNVYITGETTSSDLPIIGGYDSTFNGVIDAFIAKFNAGVAISETPRLDKLSTNDCFLMGNRLIVELNESCYLGYDVIGLDGRTMKKESIGYESKGRHEVELSLKGFSSGVYFLIVRIGDETKRIKLVWLR